MACPFYRRASEEERPASNHRKVNLDKCEVMPSPFDKLRAGSDGTAECAVSSPVVGTAETAESPAAPFDEKKASRTPSKRRNYLPPG
jgi:hypothetical protein